MQRKQVKGQKKVKRASRRTNTSRQSPKSEYKSMTAPTSVGVSRRQPFGFRFGLAQKHPDFPEGGLRLTGTSEVPYFNVGKIALASALTGPFYDSGGSSACAIPLQMDDIETIATPTSTQLINQFGQGVINISFPFNRWKIRRLVARYVPNCPTTTSGRLTLGYARDYPMALGQTGTGADYKNDAWNSSAFRYASGLPGSISAPVWESTQLEMIHERNGGTDDQLFWRDTIAAGSATGANLNSVRVMTQGALCGYVDQSSTLGVTYGSIFFDFVIDLYDFNNGKLLDLDSVAAQTRRKRAAGMPSLTRIQDAKTETKGDSKTPPLPRDQDSGRTSDEEFGAILVKSQSQPALRTEGRSVGQQDERRTWFGKSA